MRDVISEVVGKFIECGDLDFHPHLHALVAVGSRPNCGPIYGSSAIHFHSGPRSDNFYDRDRRNSDGILT